MKPVIRSLGVALSLAALVAIQLPQPAAAALTPTTGSVTIKYKTLVNATITVANGNTSAPTNNIVQGTVTATSSPNGGVCAIQDPSWASSSVNFGNILPDSTNALACYYEKAILATMTLSNTGSGNYTVTEYVSGLSTGFKLCAYGAPPTSPTAGGAFAPYTTSAPTYTAPSAANIPTNCLSSNVVDLTSTTSAAPSSNLVGTQSSLAGTYHLPEDLALIVPAGGTVVDTTGGGVTLTMTLTAT